MKKTAFFGLLAIMVFGLYDGVLAETYTYDAVGRLTSVAYGDGSSMTYTYDPNGNLLSIIAAGCTDVDDDGFSTCEGDCNDGNKDIHPDALEACNGIDDDCDGTVDGFATSCGFGECASTGTCTDGVDSCTQGPPSDEVCDGLDNDCDGQTDEPDAVDAAIWYEDFDSDAYGNASVSQQACSQPAGYVSDSTDCDDADNTINPAATEVCDGQDNDCNGTVDEGCLGNQPTVAVCDGVAHYAWVAFGDGGTNRNIAYRSCIVRGACSAVQTLVGAPTDEFHPKLACSGSTVLVSWEDTRRGNLDIFYRRSTDGGHMFGPLQGLVSSSTDERDLALVMDGTTVLAAWEDLRKGNSHIALKQSTDGGDSFGSIQFVVSAPTDETRPVMAIDGLNLLVAWEDARRGNQHVGYKQSTQGGSSFGPVKFLVSSPVDETRPVLGRNGSLVVAAWEDPRRGNPDIFSRRSMNGGDSWGPLFVVVSAPTDERNPILAMDGDLLLIAWEDRRAGNNSHIAYRRSHDGGDNYEPVAFLVSAPTDEVEPACAILGNLVACIWSDTRTGQFRPMARESTDGGVVWSPLRPLD